MIAKGNALIRANFGVDPLELEEAKWAMLFSEAVWVEGERLRNLGRLVSAMFSESKDTAEQRSERAKAQALERDSRRRRRG